MKGNSVVRLLVLFAIPTEAVASVHSIGPDGMDASALQAMGLVGSGVGIGQVEQDRPGRHNIDSPGNTHVDVLPAAAFIRTMNAPIDALIDSHPQLVAGVMISKSTGMTPQTPRGVAPGANLYASAANPFAGDIHPDDAGAISMQHVATRQNGEVRAINLSFHVSASVADGNAPLSLFVDWSARQHDVLYVVAGTETSANEFGVADNFNGITVAASDTLGGLYNHVASFNTTGHNTGSSRTLVDILAPGDDIDAPLFAGASQQVSGTSVAAPHVTGTVALLQQYADSQIAVSAPRWGVNSHRHEVMKAVLMNSADKIEDDGTRAPVGSFLGMTRTVQANTEFSVVTWLDSDALTNPTIPLDERMGTGHLNANRAFQQFAPGEWDVDGTGDVPLIGWDYGLTDGIVNNQPDMNKYVFDQPLLGGSYLAVTLAWDRVIDFEEDVNMNGQFDPGDSFASFEFPADPIDSFNDLDMYLVPKGATDSSNAVAFSTGTDTNLEHIFAEVPMTGEYELWVLQSTDNLGPQSYGLAWWAAGATPSTTGDYDGNGSVGPEDYALWVSNFGSTTDLDADGNGDQVINAADYVIWRDNLGAGSGSAALTMNVPEPGAAMLQVFAGVIVGWRSAARG